MTPEQLSVELTERWQHTGVTLYSILAGAVEAATESIVSGELGDRRLELSLDSIHVTMLVAIVLERVPGVEISEPDWLTLVATW